MYRGRMRSAGPVALLVIVCVAGCSSGADSSGNPVGSAGSAGSGGGGAGSSGGGAAGGSGAAATLVEHEVKPSEADPASGAPDLPHLAYVDPAAASNGKLFLFLPGTGQSASQTKLLPAAAAKAGYHAVVVGYPNGKALSDLCKDDLDCYGAIRTEMLDGTDASPLVTVGPADAIQTRATKLLAYLAAKYPDEGWGPFVVGNALAYDRLVISGHSQGGGHAAFLAAKHEVAKVVLFSSVVDASSATPPVPAAWLTAPHATPSNRYVALDHQGDPLKLRIEGSWEALGLTGVPTSVEGASPPFGGSSRLTMSAQSLSPHDAVVVDAFTPKVDELPALSPVWSHMLAPLRSCSHRRRRVPRYARDGAPCSIVP